MHFDEHFLKRTIPGAIISGQLPRSVSFAVDSRFVERGDVFVALQGEHRDGHDFIKEAIAAGAIGALVAVESRTKYESFLLDKKITIIMVPDPFTALINLAHAWRTHFAYPVIGVTGSIGKTSTKEHIALLLTLAGKKVLVSRGNQNTQIGAALNIMRMTSDHDVAIFEMGISRRNEMALIARLVRPTIGIITKIGHSHMEGLGSLEDIAHQKKDIFCCFSNDNIGIINGDQPVLASMAFNHPVIKFGSKTTNHIQARKIRFVENTTRMTLKIYKDKYDVVLPKAHEAAISIALIMAAVGHILGIDHQVIIKAIQTPLVVSGRFEKKELKNGRGTLINDCYNASPESMKAALLAFERMPVRAQKIAVLGDMLELGPKSPFWHRQIGRFMHKLPSLKKVILVGNLVEWIEKTLPTGVEVIRVANWQEARDRLPAVMGNREAIVLVKGSNGVGLLNLVKEYAQ